MQATPLAGENTFTAMRENYPVAFLMSTINFFYNVLVRLLRQQQLRPSWRDERPRNPSVLDHVDMAFEHYFVLFCG